MVTKISKWSRILDSCRITPKIESLVVYAMPDIPSKYQKDPSITFWVILLTGRQTNKQTNKKRQKHNLLGGGNIKFKLMLTGRAKAYSSSCPQAVTHCSTNRARRRLTSLQPKRATNDATPPTPVRGAALWMILCRSPKSPEKSMKIPILAFKVIQGHWIRRQSKASIRFPISD